MQKLRNLLRLNGRNADGTRKGEFRAEAETNTIYLYDMIVGDEWEAEFMGGIAPKPFIDALKGMTGTVHLRINSPGGDVFAATAMAQAMREHKGEIVAHVDGVAASAASVLAVSADKTIMAPGALLMIHNSWTMLGGDRNDLIEMAALLKKVDGMLAQTYAKKSGATPETFAAMMDAETWFTPEEAVTAKLADSVAEEKTKAKAAWDLSVFAKAPKADTSVTTVTTTTTVTITEEETETEVEVPDETGDAQVGSESTLAPDELEARARRHAVAMRVKEAA
jgi:ATP-dependent Clp protease, protease subunit